jgi:hypothetical protein
VSMTLFEALSHIRALDIREVRHPRAESYSSASGHAAFLPNSGLMASIHVRFDGPYAAAAVAALSSFGHGHRVDVAEEIACWMAQLRASTAHETIAEVLAKLSPEDLVLLAVALDFAQTKRPLAEYRSPADVERIAELERLLADRA